MDSVLLQVSLDNNILFDPLYGVEFLPLVGNEVHCCEAPLSDLLAVGEVLNGEALLNLEVVGEQRHLIMVWA